MWTHRFCFKVMHFHCKSLQMFYPYLHNLFASNLNWTRHLCFYLVIYKCFGWGASNGKTPKGPDCLRYATGLEGIRITLSDSFMLIIRIWNDCCIDYGSKNCTNIECYLLFIRKICYITLRAVRVLLHTFLIGKLWS